jgi:ubiquinone/menaquinone biosynthesis C-methylase UbiE
MNGTHDVRTHFNDYAAAFDQLYTGQKTGLLRWLDRSLRASVYRRFQLTFDALGDVTGKTAVDVGCGSGRYCVELARRGARRVVGVDLADNMIALARDVAIREHVPDRCEFVQGEFVNLHLTEQFDYSLALGVFDYVSDPLGLLKMMIGVTRQRLIASFPHPNLWRTILRRGRYALTTRCPLYFYDEAKVRALLWQLGYPHPAIMSTGTSSPDLVLVLDVKG